ncbi:MAG: acyl-CoA hydrolase [Deltaproteobacteria bacterium]|jgi:3-aminobutyryl-CoA ammonia-lyase|nr:acyl-CoA hydrolase [Deltaproteobacteria bacterium]
MTTDNNAPTALSMRYRMSERDAHYGGGLVNGARSLLYMGDVAARLMTELYANRGRCTGLKLCRFHSPVFAGDYLEFAARVLAREDKKVTLEIRSFKVAFVPQDPPFDSSIDVQANPELSTRAIFTYESRF